MSNERLEILWSQTSLQKATQGDAGSCTFKAYGVSIDSRTLKSGDVFIALKGPQHDGHKYLDKVFEKGAACAVVEKGTSFEAPSGMPVVWVNNSFDALWDMARFARKRYQGKLVGITGSVGKTSTKDNLAKLLGHFGAVHATQGNLNNHIGVPLTLARLPQDTDYAIIEMGMNHAREIGPLSCLAQPDVVIITTVQAAHLENFDSVLGIADAKAEIFEGLVEGGIIILNADDSCFSYLRDKVRKKDNVRSFGKCDSATYKIIEEKETHQGHTHITFEYNGKLEKFNLLQVGHHFVMNSLALVAALDACDVQREQAYPFFKELGASKGRGDLTAISYGEGYFYIVDESYNASPSSVKAALTTFENRPCLEKKGRRIAVLGDMLELGADGPKLHEALASTVEAMTLDYLFVCGGLMDFLGKRVFPHFKGGYGLTSQDLIDPLIKLVKADDIIMIKGSRGMHMEHIIEALKKLGKPKNKPHKG